MLKIDKDIDWENFKIKLSKRFRKFDKNQRLMKEISSIKQTGDIESYTDQFQEISNALTDNLTEAMILNFYIMGLSDQIKPFVNTHKPECLE